MGSSIYSVVKGLNMYVYKVQMNEFCSLYFCIITYLNDFEFKMVVFLLWKIECVSLSEMLRARVGRGSQLSTLD